MRMVGPAWRSTSPSVKTLRHTPKPMRRYIGDEAQALGYVGNEAAKAIHVIVDEPNDENEEVDDGEDGDKEFGGGGMIH